MNTPHFKTTKISLLVAALVGQQAFAVTLEDQPIQSASTIKPNLMFVLDDSGSMGWTYMPDTANSSSNCSKNFGFNTVYYNPSIRYDPPKDALGVSFPAQVFNSAETDGFNTSGANTNLSTSFNSGLSGAVNEPAFYYRYKLALPAPVAPATFSLPPGTCASNASYEKVVVSATSCTVATGRICPTGADERVNFANWYSYYRTRMLMMKSGVATAFSSIGDKYRVGFSSLHGNDIGNNGPASNFVPISDFDGTQKNAWYARLYDVNANSGTPLQTALDKVGQYYSGAASFGASPDPVQYSCQKNFTILSTDGYWNSQTTWPGNWDRTVPATMPIKEGDAAYNPANTGGLVPGAAFPRPYLEGAAADPDSLADVAMKYWITDLRTTGATAPNNVPTSNSDPAYWQHMNTLTIGLGVNGSLVYPGDLTGLTDGTKNWPNATENNSTTIDDLWHAAVNGRGNYYKATDPTSLASGLTGALAAITDASFFGVGPTSSTNDLSASDGTDFTTYFTSYKIIDWSGDVQKFNVDRVTGLKTGAPLWKTSERLDLQYPNGGTQWTNRKIVTKKPSGSTVYFTYANLDSTTDIDPITAGLQTQQSALCYKATPTGSCVAGDSRLVDYLRGDSTYEGDYGVAGKLFRNRKDLSVTTSHKRNLLGGIVDAGPYYVAAEWREYNDSTDPDYSDYFEATQSRSKTVYVGANDGMLHAIDASNGDELWAYIPSFLIRNENDTSTPTPRENGLRALSYQDNGDPSFAHHFYVNGKIEVGPVNFNHVGTDASKGATGDWRTILVGGLGKGGKGYFAVDVTTQVSDPIGKILWEFPRAGSPEVAKMGYSYGKPIIVKSHKYGWVVMLPSGYNNADGKGYVFVLNAKTGDLLETLDAGTAANGLAHIAPYGTSYSNLYVEQVYGGDLNGNIWRFDFGATPLGSRVEKILTSSTATPITSEPTVAVDENSDNRWVFAGTGQYLAAADRSTTTSQYLIAVRDGTRDAPAPGSTATLTSLTAVADLMTGVGEPAVGWKHQLALGCQAGGSGGSQRVANGPVADLRTVLFTTLIPGNDPCSPGVCGYVYGLEYNTGKTRLTMNGSAQSSVYSSTGAANAAFKKTGKNAAAPAMGAPMVEIVTGDGQVLQVGVDTSNITSSTRHVGWREMLE